MGNFKKRKQRIRGKLRKDVEKQTELGVLCGKFQEQAERERSGGGVHHGKFGEKAERETRL